MRKLVSILLSLTIVTFVFGQPLSSAKAVEVTNYEQVVSEITYPKACKEKGIEGTVIVSLEIDKKGKIVNHEFISLPSVEFKDVVTESLSKFEFDVAIGEDGQSMSSRITMPIKFILTI